MNEKKKREKKKTNRDVEGGVDETAMEFVFVTKLSDEAISNDAAEEVVREETLGEVGLVGLEDDLDEFRITDTETFAVQGPVISEEPGVSELLEPSLMRSQSRLGKELS